MRRLITIGAVMLFILAAAVPLTNAGSTPITKHVDGSITVLEPGDRLWMARFEVRTTTSGAVQFGYLELYGIGGEVAGEIHQFSVDGVDYYRTATGAQGATLDMQECVIVPRQQPCFHSPYQLADGGSNDTFMDQIGWTVQSGNISIYSTGGQNSQ